MQRNDSERRQESRRKAERDEATPPPSDPERGETNAASFLTASELQAWDPAKSAERRALAADRRRSADVPRTVHKQE